MSKASASAASNSPDKTNKKGKTASQGSIENLEEVDAEVSEENSQENTKEMS
jgi:hypothetical protein